MAGDWIKMRTSLHDDPAVVRMASALDADEYAIIGRLHRLWSWADEHTTDGLADGITSAWIDRYVSLPGFAAAMMAVGWLEINSEVLCFPNFERHNGKSAKRRALDKDRKQVVREVSASRADDMGTTEEQRTEETERSVRSVSVSVPTGRNRLRRPAVGPSPESVFRKIEIVFRMESGIDYEGLRRWFLWQSKSPEGMTPVFAPDEWESCVSIALHARKSGKEPVALFAALAGKPDHAPVLQKIPAATRQQALSLIKELGIGQRRESTVATGPPTADESLATSVS